MSSCKKFSFYGSTNKKQGMQMFIYMTNVINGPPRVILRLKTKVRNGIIPMIACAAYPHHLN